MPCVNEQTVQDLVSGRLAGAALGGVERHLAECSACAEWVVEAAGRSEPGTATAADRRLRPRAPSLAPAGPSLPTGTMVGHYVVLGFLGAGGMGEVYAAYDPSLERKVAIKFLRPDHVGRGASDVATERMRREARLVAKLSHPNVVVMYEIDVFGDRVFIAMEHVDGESVADWMRSTPRSVKEIVRVFLAAGAGLAAAHAAGVIHRDFKPHNVMLTKGGDVRVMDFGLAHLDAVADGDVDLTVTADDSAGFAFNRGAEPSSSEERLTRTGALLGTPAYMAPEQLEGRRAGARTDQYSFCVALFEALHGHRPPGAFSLPARPSTTAAAAPPKPASRKVPAWLRRILRRGLAADPERRYPSMDDLLAELGQGARRPRRVLMAAAAGIVLVAGVAWGTVHTQRARRALFCGDLAARAAAVWPLQDPAPVLAAGGDAGRSARTAWSTFQGSGVAQAGDLFARFSRTVSTYLEHWAARAQDSCEATHVRGEQSREVLALRLACLDERLDAARTLVGAMVRADEKVVAHAADAAMTLPDLDRCSELSLLRATVKPPDGAARRTEVERLRRRMAELKLLASTGHFESVAPDIKALERDIRRVGYPPLLTDFLLLVHSNLWANAGVPGAERQIVREALTVAQAAGYEEGQAEALVGMVGTEYRNGAVADLASAQADAILAHLGNPSVLRAWLETNQSLASYARGELAAAIAHTERALVLKRQRTPRDNRDLAASEGNLCVFLQAKGQPAAALPACRRAVALAVGELGSGHPQSMNAVENQGAVLAELGRFDEACPMAERVATFFRGLGERIDERATLTLALGRCALHDGEAARARALIEGTLAVVTASGGSALEIADVEWQLARIVATLGDRARAGTLAASASRRYGGLPELAFRVREIRAWQAGGARAAP